MKIIFLGTPDFAVPSLDILVKNGFDVVAVVTSTDKLGGRGGKVLLQSAIKKYALEHNIPVLQPKNLKSPSFLEELQSYKADLQIVVAFRMLPVAVWDMPPLGTYNLHGSLLPAFRGAAPINWAIISGSQETGVTTFKLKHEIDTGDIFLQKKLKIEEEDTAGSLHDKMMILGAEAVLETCQAIKNGEVKLSPQDNSKLSKAPKIYHDTCQIDFNRMSDEVYDFIRGLSPYPGAWMTIDDKMVKVFWAEKSDEDHDLETGTIVTDNKRYLKVATQNGFIVLKDVKMAGKKRMDINSLLNGYTIGA